MKKQILTIASILTFLTVFSSVSHAKKCSTENVGNSPQGAAVHTIWQSRNDDGSFAISVDYTPGKVQGVVVFKDGNFKKENILVGVSKNGNLIYDDPDDDLGSYEVSCSMSEDNKIMTTNGDTEFVVRISIPAQVNKDLGDWAPVAEPAKQSPPPPRMVQPQGGSKVSTNPDLGDWAK